MKKIMVNGKEIVFLIDYLRVGNKANQDYSQKSHDYNCSLNIVSKTRLSDYETALLEQNKKYKEVIDKAIEYINSYDDGCYTDSTCKYKVAELNITKLLDILKESD